ncbi:hypothetical protein HYZ97_02315 [Candidatus Pacearchaeota archaeon]|nr:hypothetical protein [Candidatus Pacearchaeota archaeon]
MKYTHELKNPLIGRREVSITLEAPANPGIAKITADLAEHYKISPELIVIKKLQSGFGKKTFKVEALMYDSPEVKKRFEPQPKPKKAAGAS